MDTLTTQGETIRHAGAKAVAVPGSAIHSSAPLGWHGLIAERFFHAPGEHRFSKYPENTVSLYLGQPMNSVRWSAAGTHQGRTSKGDITVKVSGQPTGWCIDKAADILCVRFKPAFMSHVAEKNDLNSDAVELRPSFDVRDQAIEHIGLAMLAEIEAGGVSGKVYGDSLATALATHLLHHHGARAQAVPDHRRGLHKSVLWRVRDYVGDNLSTDIGLSDMARVANLSDYHFSRQFKHSTGLSPHQYVIRRRVDRAKELLSNTELSVGDIASAVGFTHQSHLSRHVRRQFGVTPSALRS